MVHTSVHLTFTQPFMEALNFFFMSHILMFIKESENNITVFSIEQEIEAQRG